MKLKNKNTGEIREFNYNEVYNEFRVYKSDGIFYKTYDSLAELCEEWADYEEPKGSFYLDEIGAIHECVDYDIAEEDSRYKEIGNCFYSKEEAKKAVEKLQALKRLEDKGFHTKICKAGRYIRIEANYDVLEGDYRDLETVFGGEE